MNMKRSRRSRADASWLPATRGKAFKMVSQLLYDLPPSESTASFSWNGTLDEMLLSQEKMLKRLGRPVAPHEPIKRAYTVHLEQLHDWLEHQPNIDGSARQLQRFDGTADGASQASGEFLNGKASVEGMAKAVDTSLYRNRKPPSTSPNASATAKSPTASPQRPRLNRNRPSPNSSFWIT